MKCYSSDVAQEFSVEFHLFILDVLKRLTTETIVKEYSGNILDLGKFHYK